MMSKGFCTRGLLILLFHIDLFKSSTSYSVSDSKNLHVKLFNESTYNKLFRPRNFVSVKARYNLQYLNSVDIKTQIMSTTGWFSLFWNDSRLAWTKSSYGYIEYIYVPVELVWHPDLIVLNSVLESEKKFGAERTIQISSNGEVRWEPIAVLSTSCNMVVAFFPFDTQYCNIDLATLDYPLLAVHLEFEHPPINLGLHGTQGDWDLEETNYYSSPTWESEVLYSRLRFVLVIKRLPDHYLLIVILPTILTAILTFVTFFLPLKSGVRIGYILTVVLTLVVLLTLFANTIPSAAKYPSILVAVLTVTLGMAFLLIIITIFVMRLYNKPKRNVAPKCMHSMVRKIRKLKLKLKLKLKCRARRINRVEQNQALEDDRPTDKIDSEENSTTLKPYSNKELAEFFDNFLFFAFTVLYILILSSVPIVVIIWGNISGAN